MSILWFFRWLLLNGEIKGDATVYYDYEGNEIPDECDLQWDFNFRPEDQENYYCSNCGKNISNIINGN